MGNPWEQIALSDYENHMKLDSVMQLQALSAMMEKQFYRYPVDTIMILGVAGGNGLEHIDSVRFRKVYGVDINREYLRECEVRYRELSDTLECICTDLTAENVELPHAELLIANLLIEYIGYESFQRAVQQIVPRYVSCIIQINTDEGFVSASPYLHAFDSLAEVHHQMQEDELENAMKAINYACIERLEHTLPNGKKFVQLDFERVEAQR